MASSETFLSIICGQTLDINRVLSNRILDDVELMRGIVMHNQKENYSVIRKQD